MKIADFINELADKVGNKNHDGVKDFLSRADIQTMDLSDELCELIISGLMSLDGAKNHPTVKKHYTALALNGVDAELASAINDFGLNATVFESDKDTYTKIRTFKAKLKELLEKKNEAPEEFKKRYDDLRKDKIELDGKIAAMEEQHTAAIAAVKAESSNHVLSFLKSNHLKGFQYADKERSLDLNMKLAQMVIDEVMTQKGAKVVNKDGVLKLVQANDEAMDFYENHKPVTYEDFVQKVLADQKLLSVSDPNKGNIQQPYNYVTPVVQQPNQPAGMTSFMAAINESLEGLNN